MTALLGGMQSGRRGTIVALCRYLIPGPAFNFLFGQLLPRSAFSHSRRYGHGEAGV
jgi:hypothetical protein